MVSAPRQSPYGRRAVEVLGTLPADSRPPTYYDRPAVKASDWRWLIISYFFIGGLSGACQIIAGVVDLFGRDRDRPLVRTARYIALAGALISPLCLVSDLKTPERWYNMLRIFRRTSPMSIGSWTLLAFGGLSGLAAVAHVLEDVCGIRAARGFARLLGVPAGVAGAVLATYTGSLLAATSTPLWSVGYRLLPALFGVSGASTATAALSLALRRISTPRAVVQRLDRLALAANMLELVLSVRLETEWKSRGVSGPLEEQPLAGPYRLGAVGLGILAPLAVHAAQLLTRRELRVLSVVASVAALTGGFMLRAVVVLAGKRSAERPIDYFSETQYESQ
jgi:formate-dependent nitrite reductase membrane component NrfD